MRARPDRARVQHRPRLFSHNRPRYVSGRLCPSLESRRLEHARDVPYDPMTQGKIRDEHRSMKNLVPQHLFRHLRDIEQEISCFAEYHNSTRPHESPCTSAQEGVYFERAKEV